MFEWAKYTETKGAVKVHYRRQTAEVARGLKFEAGTIIVMDRGYEDHD